MSCRNARRQGLWCVLVCALLATLSAGTRTASPHDLIQQGNEHYTAGRYAEALDAYQQAAQAGGETLSAELLHNQAAANFRLGNREDARELWVLALALKDAAFEARARYNLGNCDYAEVLKTLESPNPQGVLEALEKAVEQYRDAIRLDPGLENARANLELAHQLKKKLEEQATTQPQSQPSTQPSDQSQQGQSTQPSDEQQSGEGSSDDQSEQNQSPSTQPSTQPQPQTQPAEPSTQPADEPPPQPEPSTQSADQNEQPGTDQQRTIRMAPEEAERLLQMIRDAEKARRRALRLRAAARHKPVDRDW